jgi:mono/diheme cytochrome c family protein
MILALAAGPLKAANPVPYTEASVNQGAQLYQLYCTACHGVDGRAQMDVIADATDLTFPEDYYNGNTPEAIYRSIKDGAGVGMPPWGQQLADDQDIWHLVNFIRSLWSDQQRQNF